MLSEGVAIKNTNLHVEILCSIDDTMVGYQNAWLRNLSTRTQTFVYKTVALFCRPVEIFGVSGNVRNASGLLCKLVLKMQ